MSEVSVIIVTHNSADIVGDAVKSIVKDNNVSCCFIVDNASNDDVRSLVDKFDCDKIILIKNENNLGFGVANNIALEQVKTPYVLLLNPDAVMQKDSIEILLKKAKEYPNAAIIAPLIYYTNGEVQKSYKNSIFKRNKNRDNFIIPDGDMCAEMLSGAVMFLNMAHMKKIGFFDPNIFLFYEDDDICMRVLEKNYELVLTPAAKATHIMGGSSGYNQDTENFKQYYMAWSRLYIHKKYYGHKVVSRHCIKLLFAFTVKLLGYYIIFNKKKINRYKSRLYGVIDFMRGKQW